MDTNNKSTQKEKCIWCSKGSNQLYCPYCGRATGRVSEPKLSQSKFSNPVKTVEIPEGGTFFIRFEHKSGATVDIECDISNAHNLLFKDKNFSDSTHIAQASKKINGFFEFSLKDYRIQPSGYLVFKINDEERDLNKIWKKKNIRTIKYPLSGKIVTASSEWIPGSDFLFFSNKLPKQNICIYNPSSIEREFLIEPPNGYNVDSANLMGSSEIPIEGYLNTVLSIEKKRTKCENPSFWEISTKKVELFELPSQKTSTRKKLRISFDLGAKTFSIRAYWIGGNLVFDKKNGYIEPIGGDSFSPTMVMDKTGKEFVFSNEADNLLPRLNNDNLVPITNLKTLIRYSNEYYTKFNSIWTNEYLLSILFSEVSKKIKNWTEELFTQTNRPIPAGFKFNNYLDKPEYVFTYPILETEEKTERYKKIFKNAFLTAFNGENIEESQISFISEPEAVFNYILSQKNSKIPLSSADGELFAIIDSGAGTTDISIGKIKKDKGTISLIDIKSVSLELTENQIQYYKTKNVGGNLFDYVFSDILDKNANIILKSSIGNIYMSLWNTLWGDDSIYKKEDKMKYCKQIKENFELKKQANDVVQIKIPLNDGMGTKEPVTVDYKAYSEHIIDPILRSAVLEANKKLLDIGIDFRKIGTVVLVGGSNICECVRTSTISKLSFSPEAIQKDEALNEYDRLYSIVEGAGRGAEQLFKTSFTTLTIKAEENEDRIIATEGESIIEDSFTLYVPYNESNDAILELFAESDYWNGTKKIATAICKRSNYLSDEDNDIATFEIEITNKKCKCTIFYPEGHSGIGWDINIA